MKKVTSLALVIISLWLVVNLGSWVSVGLLAKEIVTDNFSSLEKTQKKVNQLQVWLYWYPYLSLGTYRLSYLHPMYELIETTTDTLDQGLKLAESLEELGISALRGQTSNRQDWETLFEKLLSLGDSLGKLSEKLEDEQIINLARLVKKQSSVEQTIGSLASARHLLIALADLKPSLPKILGYEGKKHYLVLTQNNMELWPTGGYLGSFVEFWLDNGAVENLRAEAIDVPNGQLKSYVEAPKPIVKYTHDGGTPGWKLRESNWDPDFPQAAKTIEWFFVKGGIEAIDGMVAINLLPVMEVIGVIGSLELPDYQLTLTADNFYLETQKHTSFDFFQGSTQKRSFLNYTSRQLIEEILTHPQEYAFLLLKVIYQNLQNKQVLVALKDEEVHAWFNQQGWDGSLKPVNTSNTCLGDYLHINEANLGINKANCCLERQFSDTITVSDSNILTHHLKLFYINHNPKIPDPPYQWGGKYEAYTRVYVPKASRLKSLTKEGEPLDPEVIEIDEVGDKMIVAFLVYLEGGEEAVYEIVYEVNYPEFSLPPLKYELTIQKQSGIDLIPWQITVVDKTEKETRDLQVVQDMRLEFDLRP